MYTITQADMDAICNRKIRKRTILWPVEEGSIRASAVHPRTGRALSSGAGGGAAMKRCPFRKGGSYTFRSQRADRTFAERLREAKEREPTTGRARALLWLIDQYAEQTLRITVRSVEREGSYWRVTFAPDADEKLRDLLDDTPILLARGGGYSSHDEIDAGELMTPFEEDLEKARRAAREGRRGRDLEKVRAVAQEATKCRDVMRSMKQANRLRRIESDLEKLYAEVSADGAATVASSDRAAVNTPHYSGVTQSGTVGVVCSQAA